MAAGRRSLALPPLNLGGSTAAAGLLAGGIEDRLTSLQASARSNTDSPSFLCPCFAPNTGVPFANC